MYSIDANAQTVYSLYWKPGADGQGLQAYF